MSGRTTRSQTLKRNLSDVRKDEDKAEARTTVGKLMDLEANAPGEKRKFKKGEKAKINKVFNLFDVDRTGSVDQVGLECVLRNLGYRPTPQQIGMIIREAGQGKQTVTRKEFIDLMSRLEPDDEEEETPKPKKSPKASSAKKQKVEKEKVEKEKEKPEKKAKKAPKKATEKKEKETAEEQPSTPPIYTEAPKKTLGKGASFLKLNNDDGDNAILKLNRGLSITDFYTPFAGLNSEVQPESRDQYNNPAGREYDLGVEGAFNRFGILVGLFCATSSGSGLNTDNFGKNVGAALQQKGFRVEVVTTVEDFTKSLNINTFDQAWVISDKAAVPEPSKKRFSEACRDFHEKGGGLALWGDNAPWVATVNVVLEDLFQISLAGNTPGKKTLKLGDPNTSGNFAKHLLTSGIENLYEGNTICYPSQASKSVHVLATSSNNHPCMLFADYPHVSNTSGRVVIDCGITKLYCEWNTAGTERYVRNMAVWLLGLEHRLQLGSPIQGQIIIPTETTV